MNTYTNASQLYADGLLAAVLASDRDWREPVMAVVLLSVHDRVELLLQRLGDGTDHAFADLYLVDRADRGYLRGRARKERFVGNVEHLARNHLFDHRYAQVSRHLQYGVARNPRQHGTAQRRRDQLVLMHQEEVLARSLTDKTARVERDAFHVAVDDRFHLDELRVRVIGTGLGHGGQRVGSKPRPRRDTHVAAFHLAAQILPPRIVDDVDLGRRVERIHAGLAVSPQHDRADIARPRAIVRDGVDHALDQLLAGVVHVDAVDLGGVEQPLHVLVGAENRRPGRQFVTADAFEDRRAVMHDMRHHVDGCVVPVNQLAIVPDLFGLLNRHANSLVSVVSTSTLYPRAESVPWGSVGALTAATIYGDVPGAAALRACPDERHPLNDRGRANHAIGRIPGVLLR